MKIKLTAITPRCERHIERCARTAYKSKMAKTASTGANFLKGIVKNGHLSVLEHGSATFEISGVSRALSHQLVRHRHHSFTQQSQRYVNVGNKLSVFVVPPSIAHNKKAVSAYRKLLRTVLDTYQKLIIDYKIPREDARYILPNATGTTISVTGNMSAWMHFLKVRLAPSAQWEIRELALKILVLLHKKCPNIFDEIYIANVQQKVEKPNG